MSVRRPTAEELDIALAAARRMRERDVDPHHLGTGLLFLHARTQQLENLYQLLDRYLRFGMPEHELTELHRLVGKLREADLSTEHERSIDNTLPL